MRNQKATLDSLSEDRDGKAAQSVKDSKLAATGLSARLLGLTIVFIMLVEVLVFIPSVANHWRGFAERQVDVGRLIAAIVENCSAQEECERNATMVLAASNLDAVVVKEQAMRMLVAGETKLAPTTNEFDFTEPVEFKSLMAAFQTWNRHGKGNVKVVALFDPNKEGKTIEVMFAESIVFRSMIVFGKNVLFLSLIISIATASLIYLSLHILIVRPMRRITESLTAFRQDPENASLTLPPTQRSDEIGVAQHAMRLMQQEVRGAFRQQKRLADLGGAVSRINHDLRNILATLQLTSDSIAQVEDPRIKRFAPRMLAAVDRGIRLCEETLEYGKSAEPEPVLRPTKMRELFNDVAQTLNLGTPGLTEWHNDIPEDLVCPVDPDQVFRIVLNLFRNAMQSMKNTGAIRVEVDEFEDHVHFRLSDTGPGIPMDVREQLFKPFVATGRRGSTGLGLAIAFELVNAHGGDLFLASSDSSGTTFVIDLPRLPRNAGNEGKANHDTVTSTSTNDD